MVKSLEMLTSSPETIEIVAAISVILTYHGSTILIGNNELTCRDHKSRNFSAELNGLMTKDYTQQCMDGRIKNVVPYPLNTWNYLSLSKHAPAPGKEAGA